MAVSEEKIRLIIETEVAKARANIQATEKDLVHMAGGTTALDGSFGKLQKSAAAALDPMAALGKVVPMLAFGTVTANVFQTAAAFEDARKQFGILLNDAQKGDEVFSKLMDYNAKTPFDQTTLNNVGTQLLNAKVSAEDLLPTIGKLGDLSKGNSEKLATLAEVYGRITLKGKASMEELNRVIEAGVPITGALGEAMGVSEARVYDLVQNGRVGADAFRAAIDKLTGAGGQFHGMMDAMAQNLSGKWSTATGNIQILAGTLGGELTEGAKIGLDSFNELTGALTVLVTAAEPIIEPLASIVAILGSGPLKLAAGVFGTISDGLYVLEGQTWKTSSAILAAKTAVDGTNQSWTDNLKVYQDLSGKQSRTAEEAETMKTAYGNLKAMLPGVTNDTLAFALASGRAAEALKLQSTAAHLVEIGAQLKDLGPKARTATETMVSGMLAARENLKREGSIPLPYSLDLEVTSEEIGRLNKDVASRLKFTGGKSFISLGDLGFLDDATKKTVVLRKTQEIAASEAKAGDKARSESHLELAADIVAEQKALEEKAGVEQRLAAGQKTLFADLKTSSTGFISPLATADPTDADRWTEALKAYTKANAEADLANKRGALSSEELEAAHTQAAKTFLGNVAGLKTLTGEQVKTIDGLLAYARTAQSEAASAPSAFDQAVDSYFESVQGAQQAHELLGTSITELVGDENKAGQAFVDLASKLANLTPEQIHLIENIKAGIQELPPALVDVQKSLESGMGQFGAFGEIAAQAMKAFGTEQVQRDTDKFLKESGKGFGALFDSIGSTATLTMQSVSDAQTKALENEISNLEAQKAAYKQSSDAEISILEAKGESTVDARIRQANEEERLQTEIDKKKKDLARKQFETEKATKLASIAMSTAQGIAATIGAGPWAIPLTAGILALGGAQAAIVAGEQFPEAFNGAIVQGSTDGSVLRAGEKNQTELVLPLREEKLRELGLVGGSGISIGQLNVYSNAADPDEVAQAVITKIERMQRTGR